MQSVLASITECTGNIVPYHSTVKVDAQTRHWALVLPAALEQNGVQTSEVGEPFHYVVAKTDVQDAFVRVATPHGICSQYLRRNKEGLLQVGGPLMVTTP